jgi:acyl-CoA oxidase
VNAPPTASAMSRGDHPELTPFLPFLYSVWEDGVLTADELSALRPSVENQAWLSAPSKATLMSWMDASSPPSASQLAALRTRIRSAALADVGTAYESLADLGLALWEAEGKKMGPWGESGAVDALRALEAELGILGGESARRALGASPPRSRRAEAAPSFDATSLRQYLDRDHTEFRAEVLAIAEAQAATLPADLTLDEYRERVLEAVQALAAKGIGALAYPKEFGGRDDPGGSLAAFETLGYGDLSVLIKFGVQFGLFGGSVLQLGTRHHHEKYLSRIATLDLAGCYAMTETGHGSNVRDLETIATYDDSTGELVVVTPHDGAAKDFIGNAGRHGQIATVFARLVVGGADHGVHAVLVPIRGDDGQPLSGVRLEDRGLKEGLNGVDNGRIWFDGVRVPRANLLDRFATIDEEGSYSSPIPSSGRRFFTMLGTLVAGRVSIAAASLSATKLGLTIALRYTDRRPQFGPDHGDEQPLLDYLLVQRALLPELATAFASHFAIRALEQEYADGATEDTSLEVSAAALKAYMSDHCTRTLQACREACGGQGYLAENRLAALKADTDVFTTFEGANLVLYQLVAKGLLSRFRDEMSDLKLWGAVRYLAERAETTVTELNPVVTRRTDEEHLLDPDFHAQAFEYREARLLHSVATRLRARLGDGMDSFQALNECQDHVVELARAHAEKLLLIRLQEGVASAPAPGISEALRSVSALYALSRIEMNRGWYLESGYIEPVKSRAIRSQVNALCADVREHACLLIDGFGIPDGLLPAIGQSGGGA